MLFPAPLKNLLLAINWRSDEGTRIKRIGIDPGGSSIKDNGKTSGFFMKIVVGHTTHDPDSQSVQRARETVKIEGKDLSFREKRNVGIFVDRTLYVWTFFLLFATTLIQRCNSLFLPSRCIKMEIVRNKFRMPASFPKSFLSLPQGLNKLVALEKSVEAGLNTSLTQLNLSTSLHGEYRKYPLVISRFARGGKTTLLKHLCVALSEKKVLTLFISFNGATSYELEGDETAADAILHAIGKQLIKRPGDVFTNEEVVEFIERIKRPLVLVIDELNSLGVPVDREGSKLLKRTFLDPKKRFLVFSTHQIIDLNPRPERLSQSMNSSSPRDYLTIPLPATHNLTELREIADVCFDVSIAESVLYLGVPALLYSVKNQQLAVSERVRKALQSMPDLRSPETLATFLTILLSGIANEATPLLKALQLFSSVENVGKIRFPLCFVAPILGYIARPTPVITRICQIIEDRLPQIASLKCGESGFEWELVVELAILFHCLNSQLQGTRHPLLTGDVTIRSCDFLPLYEDLVDATMAKEFILKKMTEQPPQSIVYFHPIAPKFKSYDALLAYKNEIDVIKVVGISCKRGKDYTQRVEDEWIDVKYHIRAKPLALTSNKGNWTCLGMDELITLLGYSLSPLIPLASRE